MKNFIYVILVLLIGVYAIACNDSDEPKYSISIENSSIELKVGETIELKPQFTENATLVWDVDNKNVVKVENSIVKALEEGTCKITISLKEDTSKKVEVNVVVKASENQNVLVSKIIINGKDKLVIDEEVTLTVTIEPENAINKDVEWTSSDESIVACSKDGEIIAFEEGEVIITATAKDGSGVKGEFKLVVENPNKIKVGVNEQYKTISEALNNAKEGSIIVVEAGTYNENLNITKNNITILGPNANTLGNDNSRNNEAELTGKITLPSGNKGLTIKGFKFTGTAQISSLAGTAATADNVAHTITNFTFENNKVISAIDTGKGFIELNEANYNYSKNISIIGNYFTATTSTYTGLVYTDNNNGLVVNNNVFENIAKNAVYVNDTEKGKGLAGSLTFLNNRFINVTDSALWVNYMSPLVGGLSEINVSYNYLENVNGSAAIDFEAGEAAGSYKSIILNFNEFYNVKKGVWLSAGKDANGLAGIFHYNLFKHSETTYVCRVSTKNTAKVDCRFNLHLNSSGSAMSDLSIVDTYFTGGIDFKNYNFASKAEYEAEYIDFESSKGIMKYSKIIYETNGGAVEGSAIYLEGKECVLPTPEKPDATFKGWSLQQDGTTYLKKITSTMKGNITVYAIWGEIELPGFQVTYDFDGGISNELYLKNGTPSGKMVAHNYNYALGNYWNDNAYGPYIHFGDSSHDPKATFSDRIYIGLNEVTGLWEIKSVLTSGASSWPSGAKYVITMSTSFESYSTYHSVARKLVAGQVVVFSKDFESMSKKFPLEIYFYTSAPTTDSYTTKVTERDALVVPSKLGFDFLGWYDDSGKKYTSFADLTSDVKLVAKWDELTPVTDINVSQIPTEMVTGETSKIVATVVPSDAYFKDILYSTSNSDIIEVSKNGTLTAINAGVAKITLVDYVGRVVKEFSVTVNMVDSIDASFESSFDGTLNIGESTQITAVAIGKNATGVEFVYSSSNETIATVSEDGLVTAKGLGTVKITIKAKNNDNYLLMVSITVCEFNESERVDQLLSLLASNNYANVDAGNGCLYNDGTDRNYQANYGSVNRYLFKPYAVNTSYVATAEANASGHKNRRAVDTIEFVTVHDTATLTGTAASIASGMASGGTSIHYVTGNELIYAVVPEKYIAYHAGDGTGNVFSWTKTNVKVPTGAMADPQYGVNLKNGESYLTINGEETTIILPRMGNGSLATKSDLTHLGPTWKIEGGYYYIGGPLWYSDYGVIGSFGGNCNSIGIEMCVNLSGDLYHTWQLTAGLVADILIRNNLDCTRVKQHNTWTGKNCPQSMIAGNYWNEFMKMVELRYQIMKNYSDATITFESSSSIVGSDGHVIKAPLTTTAVDYKVTVKIGNVEKSIDLSSVVPGTTIWEQWNGTYPSSKIWNKGEFSIR